VSRVSACGRVCVCVCVCAWRDRAVVRRESARAVARARGGACVAIDGMMRSGVF